ncbi:hypothetical protein [Alteromonas sp. H39]|uniref:hypothetical protein n=1 Tax=Alteromonas sp. H39 TaxID=3389876 RepID=UPI0039E1D9EE
MRAPLANDETQPMSGHHKKTNATATSATIVGFLLFLTGVLLVIVGMIDVLVRIDSLRTGLMLLVGMLMYKVGHIILHHYATLRTRKERRRRPR